MFPIQVLFYKLIQFVLKYALKVLPIPQPLIYAGEDSSKQLAAFIAQQDFKKVMLVTDQVLLDLGVPNGMLEVFKEKGTPVEVYSEIKPDPTDTVIEKGIEIFRSKGCDAVIGFGGGSSIDAAKMIAIMADLNKPISKVKGIMKILRSGAPLFAVPTTAGTGSEVTFAAVVTEESSHQKMPVADPNLMPLAAALDPVLMKGMPKPITAATGMDALTHAVEAWISVNRTAETDRYALLAIKLIFGNLQKAYDDGSDLAAREAMGVAAMYAGMAFTKAGVGYVHAIAHQLGARYQVPHGLANAIVLPQILDYSEPNSRKRFAMLADTLGLGGTSEGAKSVAFLEAVKALKANLDIPDTVEKLQPTDVKGIAKEALAEAHFMYAVPRYMDQQQCESIVKKLLPSA